MFVMFSFVRKRLIYSPYLLNLKDNHAVHGEEETTSDVLHNINMIIPVRYQFLSE